MSRSTTELLVLFEDSGRHIFLHKPSLDGGKLSNRIPLIISKLLCGGGNCFRESSVSLLFT